MVPTHTIDGINYATVWHTALSIIGGGFILTGVITAFSHRYTEINIKSYRTDKVLRVHN